MSESPFSGYILGTQTQRRDINAAGGARGYLRLIAVARSEAQAVAIGARLGFPDCEVLASGPDVLARARALEANDNDARALDD